MVLLPCDEGIKRHGAHHSLQLETQPGLSKAVLSSPQLCSIYRNISYHKQKVSSCVFQLFLSSQMSKQPT